MAIGLFMIGASVSFAWAVKIGVGTLSINLFTYCIYTEAYRDSELRIRVDPIHQEKRENL